MGGGAKGQKRSQARGHARELPNIECRISVINTALTGREVGVSVSLRRGGALHQQGPKGENLNCTPVSFGDSSTAVEGVLRLLTCVHTLFFFEVFSVQF